MTFDGKTFFAVFALKGFLSVVGDFVLFESRCKLKSFSTLITLMCLFSGMHQFVKSLTTKVCKSLPTLVTFQRFFSRMNLHFVYFETARVHISLLTFVASMLFFFCNTVYTFQAEFVCSSSYLILQNKKNWASWLELQPRDWDLGA